LGWHVRMTAAFLIPLLALGPSCAAVPKLIVQNDRGGAVMMDLQEVHPVEYGRDQFQAAMRLFAEHIAVVIQHQEGQFRVRLATTSTDLMVEAYLAWCGRRDAPGDCLDLLDATAPGLSNRAKRSIALRMAIGSALEEAAYAIRNVNPVKVEALMLIWFAIYLASFLSPDVTLTKALTVVMSANMIAFMGWDGFRSFILGYREMAKAADAAQTFGQLYDAGRAYGSRMGPSMVRIVTLLVTWGLSSVTGMATPPVRNLPGGVQAAANAEAQGFHLAAVSGGSIAVSATGTATLVLAAAATVPEQGGATSKETATSTGKAAAVPSPPASGRSKLGPLKKFEVDKYGRFNAACRVGDDLCGHEVLQNSWLREHGYAARRGADASRDNPAIDQPLHDRIAVEQRKLGLFERERLARMSAEENIDLNAQALRAAGVPEPSVKAVVEEARRYAASLPR
jgi:hypothetical protein